MRAESLHPTVSVSNRPRILTKRKCLLQPMSQEIWETWGQPGTKDTLSHQEEALRREKSEEAQCVPQKISSNESQVTELEVG